MDFKKIISQMTLEEKVSHLMQVGARFFKKDAGSLNTGPLEELKISPENIKAAGTTLSCANSEGMIAIQKTHLEEDRNKLPMLFMQDVIHGYRTIFPIPLGLGCSFDSELVRECAKMSAKEAAVAGVNVTFSPMVDLVRDARWGRVMESTGEDPYLNSELARAFVQGYQGDDLKGDYNIAACVKHFAAYGAPEAGRDYNTVDMTERTLREYYLPGYHAAIEAGCKMVMPAFNTINSVPCTGNKWLLDDVLRKEWGFDGVVISDYDAWFEMVAHGFCSGEKDAAEKAFNAGCEIEMMSPCGVHYLAELIAEGKVSEEKLDLAVERVLRLKDELGMFENPYKVADPINEEKVALTAEHRAIARKAAEESSVLLKNNGVLPLKKDLKKLAVIGPFGDTGNVIGNWSCMGRDEEATTFLAGLRAYLPNTEVAYAKGCGHAIFENDESGLDEAVELAKNSEAVVLCIGEFKFYSGEGNSRADLSVPAIQMELARRVIKANPNTAVILITGRPLAIVELNNIAPAILNMWQPGTEAGTAAARLLFGDANPCGKLSMTFPYAVGQVPIYYNHYNTGRPKPNDEGEHYYCSRYVDCPNAPLYAFGYGLSYTTFEYSDFKLSSDTLTADSKITASVKVKNTGAVAGKETVQFYIRDLVGSCVRPVMELKGFEKIALAAGEEKTVEFTIDEPMLRFWNAQIEFKSEAGDFEAMVGTSSDKVTKLTFKLV